MWLRVSEPRPAAAGRSTLPSPSVAGRCAAATLVALVAAVSPAPAPLAAQDAAVSMEPDALRGVLSRQVTVGGSGGSLVLELAGDERLEILFEEGRVEVDGEPVGTYDPRGELETAWRGLLGRSVALEDGPLARALFDWAPPASLTGEAATVAERVDAALERALRPEVETAAVTARDAAAAAEDGDLRLLRSLLGRIDRLGELEELLEDVELDEPRVVIGEDVTVAEGETVEGSLLVIDGDVEIDGRVLGDVVVAGGDVELEDDGVVEGDVRVADGRLLRRGGEVEGRVVTLDEVQGAAGLDADELRERIRAEMRAEMRAHDRDRGGFLASVGRVFEHLLERIVALLGDLVKLVALVGIGALAVHFGRDHLEVVARTARRSPGRAAAVGIAGAFLSGPVWILGAVALAISLVGIPVLIAWVPLFPVAVAVAAGFGIYAVALNAGEWIAGRRYTYTRWIRSSNPYTMVAGGVTALMAPFIVADVLRLVGIGFIAGFVTALGVLLFLVACFIGFGAVLMTRGGRRPDLFPGGGVDPLDDDWDWAPPSGGPAGRGPAGSGSTGGAASAWSGPASAGSGRGASSAAPAEAAGTARETSHGAGGAERPEPRGERDPSPGRAEDESEEERP